MRRTERLCGSQLGKKKIQTPVQISECSTRRSRTGHQPARGVHERLYFNACGLGMVSARSVSCLQPFMNETSLAMLNSLVGSRAWVPGIAAGMLTMSFGSPVTSTLRNGQKLTTGEVALHVQCAWRLVHEETVLVGASDYAAADEEDEAIAYIHERLQTIFSGEPTVATVENLHASAFRLRLSNGVMCEVFPSESRPDEYAEFWRVFRVDFEGPHFIAAPTHSGG